MKVQVLIKGEQKMYITIIGAGNGGTAMAADLTLKGHHITLLKTSNKGDVAHFSAIQEQDGKITLVDKGVEKTVHIDKATYNFSEALTEQTEIVVIFMPTTYQEKIIEEIIPYLHDDQIIFLEPGYMGTIYFLRNPQAPKLILCEAQSSPIDCRITKPGRVEASFRNYHNPIGIYPKAKTELAMTKLASFDYNFIPETNIIETALHNPNLIVHTIGGIMSIPRIDYTKGDYWMYKEVFSEHIWHLVEDLDAEKMAVLEKLHLPKRSYLEACNIRNAEHPETADPATTFRDYAENNSIKGPTRSDSRYVTEDVPHGLVLLESLGEMLNIPTPTCSALITIASSCLQQDFRKHGRTVSSLGESYVKLIIVDSRRR